MPQSSPPPSRLPAWFVLVAALGSSVSAQSVSPVRLSENVPFLKEPGGVRIGLLYAGTRVTPGRSSAGHVEVTLRGWIFTASTRPDRREGFDLSARAGESIRAEPNGAALGRIVVGGLLNRVSTRGGWTQVNRTGWIPAAAVGERTSVSGSTTRPPNRPSAGDSAQAPVRPAVQDTTVRAPSDTTRSPARAAPAASAGVLIRRGATLQRGPDGATIAELAGPAPASVVARQGDWVRVQLDAWVKRGDVEGELAPPPAITAAMLQAQPERYLGQRVDWRVQFLAHQQADELRPELPRGARYLLVRGPLPETGFVYVLVTRQQADSLQGLRPLDELALVATVRATRTRYLATPVVELVRLDSK